MDTDKKQRRREICKKSYYKNRERVLEYGRKYREKFPDKRKSVCDIWKKNNKEKFDKIRKDYRNKNREILNKKSREYYSRNKESHGAVCKEWRQKNIELRRVYCANRRSLILGALGKFSNKDVLDILDSQGGMCIGCGRSIFTSPEPGSLKATVDHIQPLSRGGSNWPENIQCLCRNCNSSKNDKFFHEWVSSR